MGSMQMKRAVRNGGFLQVVMIDDTNHTARLRVRLGDAFEESELTFTYRMA